MLCLTFLTLTVICAVLGVSASTLYSFVGEGAISDDDSLDVMTSNRDIFNNVLASLTSGDTFTIPHGKFWVQGGIVGSDLKDVIIYLDGELIFNNDRSTWPKRDDGLGVQECILLCRLSNFTLTTSRDAPGYKGVLNGNGRKWWGAVRYLLHGEDRPRLLHLIDTKVWSSVPRLYCLFTVLMLTLANTSAAPPPSSLLRSGRTHPAYAAP